MEDPHLRDSMPQEFRARRRALTAQSETLRNFSREALLRAFLLHVPGTRALTVHLMWTKAKIDAAEFHALREEVRAMSGLHWAFEVWEHLYTAAVALRTLNPVASAETAEPFLSTLATASASVGVAQQTLARAPTPVDAQGRRALRVVAPDDRAVLVGYADPTEALSGAKFQVFFAHPVGCNFTWFDGSGYELLAADVQSRDVFVRHRACRADLVDNAEV